MPFLSPFPFQSIPVSIAPFRDAAGTFPLFLLTPNTDVKFREKADKELGETGGELTYTKIRQLRQQLNIYNENHQRALGCRRDDSFLLRFLRAKKFDVEKAFKMVSGFERQEWSWQV